MAAHDDEPLVRRVAFGFLVLFVVAIPVEDVYDLPGIGTPTRLLGLVAISVTVLLVVARRRMRLPGAHIGWAFAFLLWVMASMFWSADPGRTTSDIQTYVQLFAMLIMVHELCRTPDQLDRLLQALVVGSFLAALSVVQSFVAGNEAYYGRFAVPGADPNYTAVALAMVLPIAWAMARSTGSSFWRRVDLAYIVVGVAAIALTGSRAGFLSVLLAFATIVAGVRTATAREKRQLAVLLVIGVAVVASAVPTYIVERVALLGEEVGTGDLNGRVQIWRESIAAFSDSPLLGTGAGATRAVLPTGKVAHNIVLSVAVEFGLVGLVLVGGTFLAAVRGLRHLDRDRRRMLLTTTAILAFGAMSLSIESRKLTWLLIAVLGTSSANAVAGRWPDSGSGRPDRGTGPGVADGAIRDDGRPVVSSGASSVP